MSRPRARRLLHDSKALVIDPNPTSRSILMSQLRELGVATVLQASRASEGRKHLEARTFDVVICEQAFADGVTGADLLDDLRRASLLPLETIVIMVTAEATYDRVAEAAEAALDSYLLKPYSADSLTDRLTLARDRKVALAEIFAQIEAGQIDQAAALCLQRFEARERFWIYAARLGAELLIRLDRHDRARALYEAVIGEKAMPWARLGLARAQFEQGQLSAAYTTLQVLIEKEPGYVDAYDAMGRVHIEQGNFDAALAVYRMAAELTPGSLARQQKFGMLAFYMGEQEASTRALERAIVHGADAKAFDSQTLVLAAFARHQQRDAKGVQRCLDQLRSQGHRARMMHVGVNRLELQERTVAVLQDELGGRTDAALGGLRALAAQAREPGFDMEAAVNLMALLPVLAAADVDLPDRQAWTDTVARRFCAGKPSTEMLARALHGLPDLATRVRGTLGRINKLTEDAVSMVLAGQQAQAARALLIQAEKTLNRKLIDTAHGIVERHRARIAEADELRDKLQVLKDRFAGPLRVGALAPGGAMNEGRLVLRSDRRAAE